MEQRNDPKDVSLGSSKIQSVGSQKNVNNRSSGELGNSLCMMRLEPCVIAPAGTEGPEHHFCRLMCTCSWWTHLSKLIPVGAESLQTNSKSTPQLSGVLQQTILPSCQEHIGHRWSPGGPQSFFLLSSSLRPTE